MHLGDYIVNEYIYISRIVYARTRSRYSSIHFYPILAIYLHQNPKSARFSKCVIT